MYEHFNNLYSNDINDMSNENIDNIHDNTSNSETNDFLDSPITENEIHQALSTQHNGKSSGPDQIPAEIIKASYTIIRH